MLYYNVQSNEMPNKVEIDNLPDGNKIVRLHDRVFKVTEMSYENENPDPGRSGYQYDEVVFHLPYDRDESVVSIEESFSDWWAYGEQATMTEPTATLEQRVSDLEDMLLMFME